MNKIALPELMKASALSKGKAFYLVSDDNQVAFEVPVNTVHSGLDIKSTGKISVPMKTVKRLYGLASNDVALCARVKTYQKTLIEEVEKNLPPPEPEDDPRFQIYDDFAALLGVDHTKYPTSAIFQNLSTIVINMIGEE